MSKYFIAVLIGAVYFIACNKVSTNPNPVNPIDTTGNSKGPYVYVVGSEQDNSSGVQTLYIGKMVSK